jgi:hypothetical protein
MIIGNRETLKINKDYKEFLEFCEQFALYPHACLT